MVETIVRRAEPSDLDAAVALRAEMFHVMGVPETDPGWRDQTRLWFAARLADPAYRIVVVVCEGAVVACAMGAVRDAPPSPGVPDGRDILVSNVCTFPELRGRGFGTAALGAVMSWARETGIGRAELFATPFGREMYVQEGFQDSAFPAMRASLT